tara:strand:- start:2110 stop:2322 length:213 start_codon:yes stop_codon:yes gene_type:complete
MIELRMHWKEIRATFRYNRLPFVLPVFLPGSHPNRGEAFSMGYVKLFLQNFETGPNPAIPAPPPPASFDR